MEISRWKLGLVTVLLTMALAGCGGNAKEEGAGDGGAAVETGAATGEGAVGGEALGPDGRPLTSRIYFDFDSAKVDDNSRETLEAHANYLAANPDVKVKLEGHCDERGTREYNLALGERRAKAAEKLIELMGVKASRIDTTSYGEEKPLVDGHDEAAWSQNRRVEIIYPGS